MRTATAGRQAGLTYVEVLIAAVLIALALVPAIDALHTGLSSNAVYETQARQRLTVVGRMEEILAEPYAALLNAASLAGDATTASGYSEPPGTTPRAVVFVALYDADDADADGDPFTVPDPDLDGDTNPFTGYAGMLWVRVEIEGSRIAVESLVRP